MLYAIMARDVPNGGELRPRLRPQHMEHLKTLTNRGQVVFAVIQVFP